MKHMKKIIVITMGILMLLSGCGKSQIQESPAKTEAKESETAGQSMKPEIGKIILEGKTITIPCSYKELEALGFREKEANQDKVILHEPLFTSMFYGDTNDHLFLLYLGNKGPETTQEPENSDVVSFQWDANLSGNLDIEFYGRIRGDSTEDEVGKVLDEVSSSGNGNSRYALKLDGAGYSGIEVLFTEGKIKCITVNLYAEYME